MLKVECLTFKGYPRILIVNVLFPIRFDPSNPQRAIGVAAKVAKDFEYKQKKYNIFCCGLKMPIQKMSIAVRQMTYQCTETRIYESANTYIQICQHVYTYQQIVLWSAAPSSKNENVSSNGALAVTPWSFGQHP